MIKPVRSRPFLPGSSFHSHLKSEGLSFVLEETGDCAEWASSLAASLSSF